MKNLSIKIIYSLDLPHVVLSEKLKFAQSFSKNVMIKTTKNSYHDVMMFNKSIFAKKNQIGLLNLKIHAGMVSGVRITNFAILTIVVILITKNTPVCIFKANDPV